MAVTKAPIGTNSSEELLGSTSAAVKIFGPSTNSYTSKDETDRNFMTPSYTKEQPENDISSSFLDYADVEFSGQKCSSQSTEPPKAPVGQELKPEANSPNRKRDWTDHLDGSDDNESVRASPYPNIFVQKYFGDDSSEDPHTGITHNDSPGSEPSNSGLSTNEWLEMNQCTGVFESPNGNPLGGSFPDPTLAGIIYDININLFDDNAYSGIFYENDNQAVSQLVSPTPPVGLPRGHRENTHFYRLKALEFAKMARTGQYNCIFTEFFEPRRDVFVPLPTYVLPKDRGCIHIGDQRQYRSKFNVGRWRGIACDYEIG